MVRAGRLLFLGQGVFVYSSHKLTKIVGELDEGDAVIVIDRTNKFQGLPESLQIMCKVGFGWVYETLVAGWNDE